MSSKSNEITFKGLKYLDLKLYLYYNRQVNYFKGHKSRASKKGQRNCTDIAAARKFKFYTFQSFHK